MIAEIAELLKPVALRLSVSHWPSCNLFCVTVRDGGETLLEVQGPTLEGVLEQILEEARATGKAAKRRADLLG